MCLNNDYAEARERDKSAECVFIPHPAVIQITALHKHTRSNALFQLPSRECKILSVAYLGVVEIKFMVCFIPYVKLDL